jgi:hypothetical protein
MNALDLADGTEAIRESPEEVMIRILSTPEYFLEVDQSLSEEK